MPSLANNPHIVFSRVSLKKMPTQIQWRVYSNYGRVLLGLLVLGLFGTIALLQKRVVRIINKEKFDAHTDPIFKELKILKLEDIYLFHLGSFMYLFQNNLLPRPFGNLILRTNQGHNYNTRSSNQNLFYVPFCRTSLRQFCVHYQGRSFFNTLNSDIRNASSVSQFKTFLKKYLLSRLYFLAFFLCYCYSFFILVYK